MRITNWALGLAVFASMWGVAGRVSAENLSKTVKKQDVPLPIHFKPPVVRNNHSKGGGPALQPALPGNDRRLKRGSGSGGGDMLDKHPRSGRIDPDRQIFVESDSRCQDDRIFEGHAKHTPGRGKLDRITPERGGHSRGVELAEKPVLEHGRGKVAVGFGHFAVNSHWMGKRYSGDGQRDVRLDVIEFAGNSFGGVLSQRTNEGQWVKMEIEGEVDGNSIAFHTTRMLEGKNRHLNFVGCFSGNQIETDVSGRTWSGTPASGTMILWREASHAVAVNKHD